MDNFPISITRGESLGGSARRNSAFTRAINSRGLKGLVT